MEQMRNIIIDLVQQTAWAITEPMLDVIHNIIYSKYFGNGIDMAQVEATLGKKLDNTYDVSTVNTVAVIPMHGVMGKRMNMFSRISGGVSTELVKRDIQMALDNPDIDAIVLDIDSPGGMVAGVKVLSDFIYESRDKKPIVAHANGLMASAAMWVGSAASLITASDGTANVGSIGVITVHYDYSKMDEMDGIKRTHLYAGRYKAMGNDAEPLNKDAKDYIQKQIDNLYTIFVNDIARNRNASIDKVLTEMADGKIMLADDAIKVGLIDRIATLEETIQIVAQMAEDKKKDAQAVLLSADIKALDSRLNALMAKYGA